MFVQDSIPGHKQEPPKARCDSGTQPLVQELTVEFSLNALHWDFTAGCRVVRTTALSSAAVKHDFRTRKRFLIQSQDWMKLTSGNRCGFKPSARVHLTPREFGLTTRLASTVATVIPTTFADE